MKTYLLEVYIEHTLQQLNRPFSYFYKGNLLPKRGLRVRVPFRHQSLVGYVTNVTLTHDLDQVLSTSPYPILEIETFVDEEPIITEELLELIDTYSAETFTSKISLLQAVLPISLYPTSRGLKGPKIAYEFWLKVKKNPKLPLMNVRQVQWWNMVKDQAMIPRHDIKSAAAVKFLVDANLVEIVKVEKRRFVFKPIEVQSRPELTPSQQKVVQEFKASHDSTFLLEGVTGSGKTEVYLTLSEDVLKHNQNVMMIVPEIALTPVMMSYFYQRFGDKIAILHSGLTPAEKYDEYRRILKGEVKIVVGARSAIFAPLSKIGLIILDEEHSETYKQESSPFYHAREIAKWRSKYHHCKLLMGTATPALETKARANKGLYQVLTLSKRIHDQHEVSVKIVDMNQTRFLSKKSSLFSQSLFDGIATRLVRKEQSILLVNRRGYAQSIKCRNCNYVFRCPSCQIPLAFHLQIQSLKCHYCDHMTVIPHTCPECRSPQLMKQGFGIEQVVSQLQQLFPEAKIARLDTDVTGVRSTIAITLKKFQQQEIDILVGTQMVSKGLDFPNVTLVGVMLADLGLHVPSFRASERTFQLIAQVVGRTGRGSLPGEAIIQTTMPDHYAITLGSQQNYPEFYKREMKERHALQYPPYTYLARFELASRNQIEVDEIALELKTLLEEQLTMVATVIGPNVPYPELFASVYRRRILMKYKNPELFIRKIKLIYPLLLTKKHVKIQLNLDPYDH